MGEKTVRFRNSQRQCRSCGCSMKPIGKKQHTNGHHSYVYECRNKGCDREGQQVLVG